MTAWRRLSAEDGRRRRTGAFACLAAATLAFHLVVLGGLRWTWQRPAAVRAPAAAMQMRVVAAAPLPRPEATPALPPLPARPAAPLPARPKARATAPAPAPRTEEVERVATDAATADPDDEPPPVYRTRLPASTTLRYDVGRGATGGTGELRWRLAVDSYALDWQGHAGDAALPTQASRGGVDAAGIAPLRFVDQRASRAAVAVNFQRDTGRITFSRKAAPAALAPGAQDRLTWLLQLAAIVAAEPELRERGREVRISVAGAGGDVAVWRLRCEGPQTLDGRPTLHYLREARGPYDTRAEVWLGSGDGRYLPERVAWRSGPSDDGIELRLREAVAGEPE